MNLAYREDLFQICEQLMVDLLILEINDFILEDHEFQYFNQGLKEMQSLLRHLQVPSEMVQLLQSNRELLEDCFGAGIMNKLAFGILNTSLFQVLGFLRSGQMPQSFEQIQSDWLITLTLGGYPLARVR